MREPNLSGIAKPYLIEQSAEAIQAHIKEWGYEPTTLRQWYINGPDHPLLNIIYWECMNETIQPG